MQIFVPSYNFDAGRTIYDGYASAWQESGYEVIRDESEAEKTKESLICMMTDGKLNWKLINKSDLVFLYVQPNYMPKHWGTHPNFISGCSIETIETLNRMPHVKKWCFSRLNKDKTFYRHWENVRYVPLAFDSVNYKDIPCVNSIFDVCYIGGVANNGFNEKILIIRDYLGEFKKSGLKCGFFINKGLSHEMENKILYNSKICLNIHDAYQQELKADTNERTFKSIGLCGALVSDNVEEIWNLGLNQASLVSSPKEMVQEVQVMLLNQKKLEENKEVAKANVRLNHTYFNRIGELLR